MQNLKLTELDSVPAEPVSRKHHLTKSKSRSECREIAHGDDADQVEEQTNETCVCKSKKEKPLSEKANGERGHDHVGRKPLRLKLVLYILR
jgi:hypothetical protein